MSVKIRISKKLYDLPDESRMKWTFEQRAGGWTIAKSESGERRKFIFQAQKDTLHASLRGYLWSGLYQREERHSGRSHSKSDPSASDLVAQFPGRVRKILVTKGLPVKEGDSLVLVEAMKMEFTIRAPYPGLIRKILVQEGQQLNPGDLFVDLEIIESES